MAKLDPVTLHPLAGVPYEQIEFVKLNNKRVPLYKVRGVTSSEMGAKAALAQAFRRYGGKCFYCPVTFKAQPLSKSPAHRDHVVAHSVGGSDRLHNLVIACKKCGSDKGARSLEDFKPSAAREYIYALERHIARALGGS